MLNMLKLIVEVSFGGVATANMLFEYRPRTGLVGLVSILSVQQDFAHDDRHMMLFNKCGNMR